MINIAFILNYTASIILLFWPVIFVSLFLKINPINPVSLMFLVGLPVNFAIVFLGPIFNIEGAPFNMGYQFALLSSNIYIVAQLLGAVIAYSILRRMNLKTNKLFLKNRYSNNVKSHSSYFFLIIFFVTLYALASSSFGVINWILNPRMGYQLHRVGSGHLYALCITFLSLSYVLRITSNPVPVAIIWQSFFYLILSCFLGSKGLILSYFLSGVIFLWFVKWGGLNKMIFMGAPFVFLLMVFNLYLSYGDGFEMSLILSYFDYYKNASMYYEDYLSGNLKLFYGDIFLSSFWEYIPRALFESKPFVYGVTHINEIYFPGAAEMTNTPAFGGNVIQFADFGYIGLILFGIFSAQSISLALVSYFILKNKIFDINKLPFIPLVIVLFNFSPGFGMFFPFVYAIIILLFLYLVLEVTRIFRRYI